MWKCFRTACAYDEYQADILGRYIARGSEIWLDISNLIFLGETMNWLLRDLGRDHSLARQIFPSGPVSSIAYRGVRFRNRVGDDPPEDYSELF